MEDILAKLGDKLHAVGTSLKATNPADAIVCGCVCYSNAIPGIWEGMRQYFISVGMPFDVVFFMT